MKACQTKGIPDPCVLTVQCIFMSCAHAMQIFKSRAYNHKYSDQKTKVAHKKLTQEAPLALVFPTRLAGLSEPSCSIWRFYLEIGIRYEKACKHKRQHENRGVRQKSGGDSTLMPMYL